MTPQKYLSKVRYQIQYQYQTKLEMSLNAIQDEKTRLKALSYLTLILFQENAVGAGARFRDFNHVEQNGRNTSDFISPIAMKYYNHKSNVSRRPVIGTFDRIQRCLED